jgi:hypothetical protein
VVCFVGPAFPPNLGRSREPLSQVSRKLSLAGFIDFTSILTYPPLSIPIKE